jgi:hypothetical protein
MERRRLELMENLSSEGKAIYETISAVMDRAHENLKAEIGDIIKSLVADAVTASLDLVVDKAVDQKMNAAVRNMQAYTDGLESDLMGS